MEFQFRTLLPTNFIEFFFFFPSISFDLIICFSDIVLHPPRTLYILQRYYPSGKLFQQKEQLNIVGPLYRCISLESDERLPPLVYERWNTVVLPSHLSRFRTLIRLVVYRGASSSCRKVISAKYDFRADLKFHDRSARSFYTGIRIPNGDRAARISLFRYNLLTRSISTRFVRSKITNFTKYEIFTARRSFLGRNGETRVTSVSHR